MTNDYALIVTVSWARSGLPVLLARGGVGSRTLDDLEGKLAILDVNDYPVTWLERASKHHARKLVLHLALNDTPEWPGAELGVEALFGQQFHCLVGDWRTEYNTYRPHSALDGLTPADYAEQWRGDYILDEA